MGTDEIKMPEGYAEMLKAAQEQAIKAAQAQAQAMLGNMPGVQFADMEEIQKQMQAGMPDMAQIQAMQAQMQGTIQEMMSNPESFCSWEIEKANDGKLDDKQLYLFLRQSIRCRNDKTANGGMVGHTGSRFGNRHDPMAIR